jgi:hypothetical protein
MWPPRSPVQKGGEVILRRQPGPAGSAGVELVDPLLRVGFALGVS